VVVATELISGATTVVAQATLPKGAHTPTEVTETYTTATQLLMQGMEDLPANRRILPICASRWSSTKVMDTP
jgi:hypothetical protein